MREIPLKNYIILVILLIITVLLTFWIFSFYKEKEAVSPLYKYLNSIRTDELNEFIIENPDSIIFVQSKLDMSNLDKQKELKKKIEKNNLKDYSIFLELDLLEDIKNLKIEGYDKKFKACQSIIFVESGKVEDVFCIKDIDKINKKIDGILND